MCVDTGVASGAGQILVFSVRDVLVRPEGGIKFDLINHHFKLEFVDSGFYFVKDKIIL